MPPQFNGNTFDTLDDAITLYAQQPGQAGAPAVTRDLSTAADNSNYILIELHSVLQRAQKDQLKSLKCEFQQYTGGNVWMCRYEPVDLAVLEELEFVKSVVVLPPALKIQPALKPGEGDAEQKAKTVDVVMHQAADQSIEELLKNINSLTGIDTAEMSVRRDGSIVRLNGVEQGQLMDIAKIDSVGAIEAVRSMTLYNNVAHKVMHAETLFNGTNYKGSGQIVTVCDTGFDQGSTSRAHPAFGNRVKELLPIGRRVKTNDPDGHGTHVCGSVLGHGVSASMGSPEIQGTAPEAELIVQSLLADDEKSLFGPLGRDVTMIDLLSAAHQRGSHVHTNSWGPEWDPVTGQIPYGASSNEVDSFVWDNKDMLVLFAAGNDGRRPIPRWRGRRGLGHIGAHSAAKNCITVGSTDNNRKSKDSSFVSFQADGPNQGNPDNISSFSSRGPTLENRIKPDVVAPGGMILSTKSRDVKTNDHEAYGKSTDPAWMFSSGTSMATPLVAGCVATLRQSLVDNNVPNPSAALVKALLINGAVDTGKPQSAQGFGRVDLGNSIIVRGVTTNRDFIEGEVVDADGQDEVEVSFPLSQYLPATEPVGTLKATLTYMDKPGATLQNDINLTVIETTRGSRRYGNMGESQTNSHDSNNTVEQVVWKGLPRAAQMTLRVSIESTRAMLSDSQQFALVWSVV